MARQTKTRRAASRSAPRPELQPRDLLLASLGAISLGRKQAIKSYAGGFEGFSELRSRAEAALQDAVETVNGQVADLRKQARAQVAPMRKKVVALATQARSQAEIRLAPVLAKFGVKPEVKKRASKRVAKPVSKRTRKAA